MKMKIVRTETHHPPTRWHHESKGGMHHPSLCSSTAANHTHYQASAEATPTPTAPSAAWRSGSGATPGESPRGRRAGWTLQVAVVGAGQAPHNHPPPHHCHLPPHLAPGASHAHVSKKLTHSVQSGEIPSETSALAGGPRRLAMRASLHHRVDYHTEHLAFASRPTPINKPFMYSLILPASPTDLSERLL